MGSTSSTRSVSCRRVMEERWAGRREFWQDLMNRFEESGMSIVAFCKNEGVHATSFYSWRRRLQDKTETTQGTGFVPLEFSAPQTGKSGCGISVRIGGGVCLRLEKGFSTDELLRAVTALRSIQC